jgi:hypothetical protein
MDELGIASTRDLFAFTTIKDDSVSRQAQRASIGLLYARLRKYRGRLGFPVSDIRFENGVGIQQFAGGRIECQSMSPKGYSGPAVRVRFLGFKCLQESDSDGLSPSDEPYFMISVVGSNGSTTTRFGPYGKIETGVEQSETTLLTDPYADAGRVIVPPITVGVVAMEWDSGTPEEAEKKVRQSVEAIESKLEAAVASFSGIQADSHVMPEWAREIYVGWLPEGIAAVFGLGDDRIGATSKVYFDFDRNLEKWQSIPSIGKFSDNPYNAKILVDGRDEGKYELMFQIDIVEIVKEIS